MKSCPYIIDLGEQYLSLGALVRLLVIRPKIGHLSSKDDNMICLIVNLCVQCLSQFLCVPSGGRGGGS